MLPVAPVMVPLRRSRLLAAALFLAHGLALGGALVADLPVLLRGLVGLAVLLSAVHEARRWMRPLPCLMLHADGHLKKLGAGEAAPLGPLAAGECEEATLVEVDPSSRLLGPLLVLRYRENGRLFSLTLLPDSVTTDQDWRRLCRWLRWQAGKTLSDARV